MPQQRPQHGAKSRPDRQNEAGQENGPAQQPAQPSTDEQSGSTGRRAVDQDTPAGQDTGQDRYGQSGFAGTPRETIGQASYRRSGASRKSRSKPA